MKSDTMSEEGCTTTVRGAIWDLPLRLFHWALVPLIAGAWWTAENQLLDWHLYIGMTLLILMLFRLIWGFVGGSTARFTNFAPRPSHIRAYLSDPAGWHGVGHNPLGSLSVLALLATMVLQISLGLFATDNDGLMEGPMAGHISLDASEQVTQWHASVFNILLGLIVLHVAAIIFYKLRGKDLLHAMIRGDGDIRSDAEPLRKARWWAALLALIAAWAIAGIIWVIGTGGAIGG